MLNYILKRIFIPREPLSDKYLLISAEIVEINNIKYTNIRFLVKCSNIKDNYLGYVVLDGLCFGNKLNFFEKFIGKKVLINVVTGRSSRIMNKRIVQSIKYRRKEYELSDCL